VKIRLNFSRGCGNGICSGPATRSTSKHYAATQATTPVKKVTATSHFLLSRKGGAKERLFIYSRGRGGRPIRLNRKLIRNKTVVVLDEVHRARGLLAKFARSELKRRPKNVWFVFVSATPVNPVSHDYLCNSLNVQTLDQREDREIRTGYLRLYKALVNLSYFTKQYRESYIDKLSKSKKLEELKATLKEISDKLAVPGCTALCELKKKLRIRKRPRGSVTSTDTVGAVERLVRFQEAVRAADGANTRNAVKKMGVLEHFAIAGALYPQKKVVEKVLSFPKDKHHNLSKTEYACDDLHKQHSDQIEKMTYKLDRLREFLEQHLQRKKGGKVVIFCNYRRTAWWVSAWLEKNLSYREPGGGSGGVEKLYGKMGNLRRVVDTVTYSSSKNQKEAAQSAAKDRKLVDIFNSEKNSAVVLVTTDRLSESVDLHKQCNTLIHFDLAWSPLRMMQRVGRLWRYGAYNSPGRIGPLPPFPQVYHLRYPCSVDDEKYARLKRRWERLGELALGLDFVPFEACVGEELGGWEREVQDWMPPANAQERMRGRHPRKTAGLKLQCIDAA